MTGDDVMDRGPQGWGSRGVNHITDTDQTSILPHTLVSSFDHSTSMTRYRYSVVLRANEQQ